MELSRAMGEEYFLSPVFRDLLKKEYDRSKSSFEKLVDEVLYTLEKVFENSNTKIHSLGARKTKIKTFDSVYEKARRKQAKEDPLSKVEDIAGVRIICLYRSDLEKIRKIIANSFDIVKSDTSRTRTETPFGYSSDHYIVRFSEKCKGTRYDDIKGLPCEIQVRTILMDAWASVSHHLDYKQEIDIPTALRVDFNALAGLFYVADTHFEMFRGGVEEARTKLIRSIQKGTFELDQEINLDGLKAYLESKFPERESTHVDYSHLVRELQPFGYKVIRQLDDKINIALPILSEYEMDFKRAFARKHGTKVKPNKKKGVLWNTSGVVRAILDITDDAYLKSRARWMKKQGLFAIVEKHKTKLHDNDR